MASKARTYERTWTGGSMPHGTTKRSEQLEGAPLQYAPENELGVVFLFCHIAKSLRLKVERIRPGFPDCIAYEKAAGSEISVRTTLSLRCEMNSGSTRWSAPAGNRPGVNGRLK